MAQIKIISETCLLIQAKNGVYGGLLVQIYDSFGMPQPTDMTWLDITCNFDTYCFQ